MNSKLVLAWLLAAVGAIVVVGTSAIPEMRYNVHVVDEDGKPISGVTATYSFDQGPNYSGKSTDVEVTTDDNGNLTAEGYSLDGIPKGRRPLIKEGYYQSGVADQSNYTTSKNGHWQPWDQTYTTVMRKVGKPIPLYVRKFGTKIPGAINEPCGYDLEEFDWVAPYGKGKVADFIVTVTYLKYTDYNNNEMSATITFSNDGDGIQEVNLPKEFAVSRFKWPREAPEAGYQPKFEAQKIWSMSPQKMFNTANGVDGYFFRVRTVKQNGKIISAFYGKILGGIGNSPNEDKTGYLGFTYYLNPTSLDRNLEWEPTKNLAPTPKDLNLLVREP